RNDRRLSNFATLQPLLPCRVWNLRPKHWGDGRRRRSYVLSGEFLGGLVEGGEHDCAKTLRRARWPSRLLRTNSPKINGSKSRICCPRAERMCTCRPATPQSDFLECAAHRFPNLGILVVLRILQGVGSLPGVGADFAEGLGRSLADLWVPVFQK